MKQAVESGMNIYFTNIMTVDQVPLWTFRSDHLRVNCIDQEPQHFRNKQAANNSI